MGAMRLSMLILVTAGAALAQSDSGRPPRLFREDFKEIPAATPITQDHLTSPAVTLVLYGPGNGGMKKSHHDTPADDPFYIWDGICKGNCMAALRPKPS